jgi:hypothetical protein
MIKPAPPVSISKTLNSTSTQQLSSDCKFKGITRPGYLGILILLVVIATIFKGFHSESANIFVFLQVFVIMQIAMFTRFVNIGHSGWLSLIALIPILYPFISVYCLLAPPQYAIHKKGDAVMNAGIPLIGFIVFWLILINGVNSIR